MKKFQVILFILITAFSLMAEDFYINGSNELKYIYKARKDSLNTFFEDEFGFNFSYGKFSYGMKFIARLPKYDFFDNKEFLKASDLYTVWDERYVSFESDNFYILGGIYQESFGTGIVLSSIYDKDFDIDTRITGSQIRINSNGWSIKGIYGTIKDDEKKNSTDVVFGADLEKTIKSFIFGGSALVYRKIHNLDNKFSKYNIYSAKANYSSDIFEANIEFDKIKEDSLNNELSDLKDGIALYATTNIYLKKITLTAGYKKYQDFDIYINDPPRLNYSDEPLSENIKAGKDEEGFMGEIRFEPNYENNLIVNYSEAWNKEKTIKLSDAYLKAEHDFDDKALTLEFSRTERYEEPISEWTKEIIPVVSYDTKFNNIALHLKAQYKIKEKVHFEEETIEYEPYFQSDFSYKDKSLSLILVYPHKDFDNLLKNKLWLGLEGKASIFENLDVTLFVGKEKGGKVCRNGVCKYQSQFSGVKLNLNTSF